MSPGNHMAPRHMALAVFAVLALLFVLAPLLIVVLNSFSSVAYNVFPPPGLSLRWYQTLAAQSSFYGAAIRSIVLAVGATACSLVLGTMSAYALARYRIPGTGLIRAVLLSPMVVPQMVLGVAIFIFFVRIKMSDNPTDLLFVHTLVCVPFVTTVMTAAFHNFDWEQQEAAMDLGARPARTFLRVVMPQVATHLFIAGLLAFVISFDQVETSIFLTRPGSTTLPIEMFLYLQREQDPTIAALSTLLIVFAIVLLAITGIVFSKRRLPLAGGEPGLGS